MRTKFKDFGLDDDEIREGDYVLVRNPVYVYPMTQNMYNPEFKDQIGLVLRVRKHYDEIDVEFEPPIGKFLGYKLSDVEYWSRNKEDLERLILIKKFNV